MGSIDLTCTAISSQPLIFRMKAIIVSCLVVVLSVYLEAALVDVNKDGVYDRNEFHWAFPNADLYQEFDRVDANKDGLITGEEVEGSRTSQCPSDCQQNPCNCDIASGEYLNCVMNRDCFWDRSLGWSSGRCRCHTIDEIINLGG